jgi:hypothetical protein
MTDDIPEEDKWLVPPSKPILKHCEHDYVDFYCGWGPAKDDHQSRLVWVFCKKCLNTRQLRLNMHNVEQEDEE